MQRRKHERYNLWFPVQISTDEFGALAINHNVGGGGMLVASAAALRVGQRVKVTFSLPGNGEERIAKASIVRIEPNTEDPEGAWPNRIALEFSEPDGELEQLVQAATDRVSSTG